MWCGFQNDDASHIAHRNLVLWLICTYMANTHRVRVCCVVRAEFKSAMGFAVAHHRHRHQHHLHVFGCANTRGRWQIEILTGIYSFFLARHGLSVCLSLCVCVCASIGACNAKLFCVDGAQINLECQIS